MGDSNNQIIGSENKTINKFRQIAKDTQHTNLIITGLPMTHLEPEPYYWKILLYRE